MKAPETASRLDDSDDSAAARTSSSGGGRAGLGDAAMGSPSTNTTASSGGAGGAASAGEDASSRHLPNTTVFVKNVPISDTERRDPARRAIYMDRCTDVVAIALHRTTEDVAGLFKVHVPVKDKKGRRRFFPDGGVFWQFASPDVASAVCQAIEAQRIFVELRAPGVELAVDAVPATGVVLQRHIIHAARCGSEEEASVCDLARRITNPTGTRRDAVHSGCVWSAMAKSSSRRKRKGKHHHHRPRGGGGGVLPSQDRDVTAGGDPAS